MSWLKNLKISTKLLGSFALVVAITVVVGWMGYSDVQTLCQGIRELYDGKLVPIRDLGYANAALLISRTDLQKLLLTDSPEERQKLVASIREESAKVDSLMEKYGKTDLDKEGPTGRVR